MCGHAVYYRLQAAAGLVPGVVGSCFRQGGSNQLHLAWTHPLHTQVETWAEIDINSNIYYKIIKRDNVYRLWSNTIQAILLAASFNPDHNMTWKQMRLR